MSDEDQTKQAAEIGITLDVQSCVQFQPLPDLTPPTPAGMVAKITAELGCVETVPSTDLLGSSSFVEMLHGYTELDEKLDQLAPLVRARMFAGLPPY